MCKLNRSWMSTINNSNNSVGINPERMLDSMEVAMYQSDVSQIAANTTFFDSLSWLRKLQRCPCDEYRPVTGGFPPQKPSNALSFFMSFVNKKIPVNTTWRDELCVSKHFSLGSIPFFTHQVWVPHIFASELSLHLLYSGLLSQWCRLMNNITCFPINTTPIFLHNSKIWDTFIANLKKIACENAECSGFVGSLISNI